jgi:hypothetical protein
VINMLGPERVYISGEGVDIYELSKDQARATMHDLLHWTADEVPIEAQPFGFAEWARGGAVVALQTYIGLIQQGDVPTSPHQNTNADPSRGAA